MSASCAKRIHCQNASCWSVSKACKLVRSIGKSTDGDCSKYSQKALCKSVDKNLLPLGRNRQ